ncbi:MAG: DUF2851 family protein [Chitinophagaceae bacterium]
MNERLLQFIWQYKLWKTEIPLLSTEGKEIQIIHNGISNQNAGPDFLGAKIKIDNTTWVGHIELHQKTSDWNKHKHSSDENYKNIILHVVYDHDTTLSSTAFHTLELKNYIAPEFLSRYEFLMNQRSFIACEQHLNEVKNIVITQQLDRMLAERLEQKVENIELLLEQSKQNWQEVFYIILAKAFGLYINQYPFEQLALQTPLSLFAKHKNNLVQLEALLLGQAGFLQNYFDEEYTQTLQTEYSYLQKLYKLQPIETKLWKFLRLRPANFPTLRLAQFASLIHQSTHLFSKLLEADSVKEIENLLKISASTFWDTHYTLEEKSIEKKKVIGRSFIHLIIINAIAPCQYLYGKYQQKNEYCEKAFNLLKQIPAEKNALIKKFNALGLKTKQAADSQAILQLHKYYCEPKKCLQCSIGYAILKK